MNNEMQLSAMNGMQPMLPGMGGGLGAPYGGGPNAPTEDGAFRKVHRLLRGRYLLAAILGLVGAAAGAIAGYMSQKPAFRADGMIEIRPVISGYNAGDDKVMAMFSNYVNSQAQAVMSESTIKAAMESDSWQRVRKGKVDSDAINAFMNNLTVQLAPKSNTIILVGYSDNSSDSKEVVRAAVKSVLAVYESRYDKDDATKVDKRLAAVDSELKRINEEVDAKLKEIDSYAQSAETDETMRLLSQQLAERSLELQRLKEQLAVAEDAIGLGDALQPFGASWTTLRSAATYAARFANPRPTADRWAQVDRTMANLVTRRNEAAHALSNVAIQLGQSHPIVVRARNELQNCETEIETYAATLRQQFVIRWNADGTGTLLTTNLRVLQQAINRLEAQVGVDPNTKLPGAEVIRLRELRKNASKIASAREVILRENARRVELSQQRKDLEFRQQNSAPMKILSRGDVAKPDKDRRPVFAAVGFMGGAGIPIGLLLLFGMFDTRYRYSDETAAGGSGIGGLTLLGILPNLPDRLSDPEQAAIAAHCVHQIRTMLQINTGLEDRRVFAVTSASPGDGKTSLTLALGLSYAACGTRTLLIDCDLIGSGLSSRMNVNAAEGVLEAITHRSLLPFVKQTDVADVSILPVGTAGNLHASTLSPQALRRLIEEAEQHYEVILIDTGPVLGSIEASLVCAASDAVILTVSRGQQRPMVERSLGHLAAIGARLAGVVFNRAQAQDFERSISGVSMRSVGVPALPRGARTAGPRMGPVARAVQSQQPGKPGGVASDDHDGYAGQ